MNSNSEVIERPVDTAPEAHSRFTRFLRRRFLASLAGLRDCELKLHDDGETFVLGTAAAGTEPLRAEIHVVSAEFYRRLAMNGSVGVAEAYMDELWRCDDLTALVRIFVRNRGLLDAMETGSARIGGWLMQALHVFRRNTRAGSRKNIAEHYDLGNDLFRLFLDRNLMYSSAIFVHEHESLEVAATRKLDRICQKLDLKPGDHVVEIGTGWGGFALHAAKHYGCRITTTTISREQHALASQRVAEAGLSDRVTLLLSDYRDLDGQYDKLVSIEMIEAIGHQYLDTYFAKCSSLLKADGLALIQAITIEDHRYAQALTSVDFIKRYIFPGSFIPSVSAMLEASGRVSDLKLTQLEDIGPSYAVTLRIWHERFMEKLGAVRELGYPDRFIRMWRWYLAYCEGGFIERAIGDVQMLLAKPGARRAQYLPDLNPTL
ncbi:MAG: class I SAM-dependent methyltransferase [Xanthomonadales bacterium]|nr:class I SAM-dependent methyltransferase [Xanthomonadales bacterium]